MSKTDQQLGVAAVELKKVGRLDAEPLRCLKSQMRDPGILRTSIGCMPIYSRKCVYLLKEKVFNQ